MAPTQTHEPRVALGTVQWGMAYGIANHLGPPDSTGVEEILEIARARGIGTLDTARAYGRAEEVIGQHVRGDSVRVVTKLTPDLDARDADRALEQVEASLQTSLRLLGRSRIDTLLLHRMAHLDAHGGRVWERLREAQSRTLVGKLGVSAATPAEALSVLVRPDVDVVQVACSLMDQRLWRAGFFERARRAGKEVFVRSVFLQGVAFLSPEALPKDLDGLRPALTHIQQVADQLGVPAAVLWIEFARQLTADYVLFGVESPSQLEANLRWWDLPSPDPAVMRELVDAIGLLDDRWVDPSRWSTKS